MKWFYIANSSKNEACPVTSVVISAAVISVVIDSVHTFLDLMIFVVTAAESDLLVLCFHCQQQLIKNQNNQNDFLLIDVRLSTVL